MDVIEKDENQIIIVEDEGIALLSLKKMLRYAGYERITVATSGEEALKLAESSPPAAAVLDIRLGPGIDGIETGRLLKEKYGTSLIFNTAFSDSLSRQAAEELGSFGYFTKPAPTDELLGVLKEALHGHRPALATPRPGKAEVKLDPFSAEEQRALEADNILGLLYDTANIGMCVTDSEARFVRVNTAYCRTYGYDREELLGNVFTLVLPVEDRERGERLHREFIEGELLELPGEWRVMTKQGVLRDVHVTAGRMITREGKAYKVTTVTDITAQKQQFRRLEQAVAEKEVLLREVHHRVKNNLNTITSLLTLQQQANETDRRLGQILTDSISRIRTMSTIYDRLHRSGELTRIDMKGYLSELATSLVSAAGRPRDILQTNIEEIEVDIDTGIAIGLISNELVSNSLKYGVSEDGADEVSLDFRVTPAELKLTVGDNGSGFPADFDIAKLNSLGLQLIQAVTMQHGGNIEIVRNAPPLIEVRFPRRTSAR